MGMSKIRVYLLPETKQKLQELAATRGTSQVKLVNEFLVKASFSPNPFLPISHRTEKKMNQFYVDRKALKKLRFHASQLCMRTGDYYGSVVEEFVNNSELPA